MLFSWFCYFFKLLVIGIIIAITVYINYSHMCHKVTFSKIDAQIAVYHARYARGHFKSTRRRESRFYWCKECNGFHLTSKSKKKNPSEWEGFFYINFN